MNVENIMLSERRQTQKALYCMTQFIGNIQNRQTHRDRKQISCYQGLEEGKWEGLLNGDVVSFWGDEECSGTRWC